MAIRRPRLRDPEARRLLHVRIGRREPVLRPRPRGWDPLLLQCLPTPGPPAGPGKRQFQRHCLPLPRLELRARRSFRERAQCRCRPRVRQVGNLPFPGEGRHHARVHLRQSGSGSRVHGQLVSRCPRGTRRPCPANRRVAAPGMGGDSRALQLEGVGGELLRMLPLQPQPQDFLHRGGQTGDLRHPAPGALPEAHHRMPEPRCHDLSHRPRCQ